MRVNTRQKGGKWMQHRVNVVYEEYKAMPRSINDSSLIIEINEVLDNLFQQFKTQELDFLLDEYRRYTNNKIVLLHDANVALYRLYLLGIFTDYVISRHIECSFVKELQMLHDISKNIIEAGYEWYAEYQNKFNSMLKNENVDSIYDLIATIVKLKLPKTHTKMFYNLISENTSYNHELSKLRENRNLFNDFIDNNKGLFSSITYERVTTSSISTLLISTDKADEFLTKYIGLQYLLEEPCDVIPEIKSMVFDIIKCIELGDKDAMKMSACDNDNELCPDCSYEEMFVIDSLARCPLDWEYLGKPVKMYLENEMDDKDLYGLSKLSKYEEKLKNIFKV